MPFVWLTPRCGFWTEHCRLPIESVLVGPSPKVYLGPPWPTEGPVVFEQAISSDLVPLLEARGPTLWSEGSGMSAMPDPSMDYAQNPQVT